MTTSPADLPTALTRAASALVEVLTVDDRAGALADVSEPSWTTWSYLPGDREGLPLESAGSDVLDRVQALVDASHSTHGAELVRGAIEVERARRHAVTGEMPTSDRYWLRVLGDPTGGGPWAWRLNGHHVGVHVTVVDGRVTVTPNFVGSEPARISTGPLAGTRLLAPEEDLARELLASLEPHRREQAVSSDVAPDDILSGMDPAVDPSVLPAGVRRGDLDAGQQGRLDALVRRYLGRLPTAYGQSVWEETMDTAADEVAFAWAGGTGPGEGHYYCVTSPVFLIEYDNTQDGANHAHSVLRHLRDDFGGDALRGHRRTAH